MADGGRYRWLTREVWEDTWKRSYRFARSLRHEDQQAQDFAQAAILKSLDPEKRPWEPLGPRTFTSHVCGRLYSAHGNHVQSYAVLKASHAITDDMLTAVDRRTPEQNAEQGRRDALAVQRLAALVVRIEDDALVRLLLDPSEQAQRMSSTERALAAGHTLDDIESARKRLKRHIEAVVLELPSPVETEEP